MCVKIYWWSYVTSISHHLPSYSFSWDFFTLSSSICNRQRETTWPNRSLEQINSRGSTPNHLSWLLPCCCCTVHMSPNQTVCHGCCHAVAVHCTLHMSPNQYICHGCFHAVAVHCTLHRSPNQTIWHGCCLLLLLLLHRSPNQTICLAAACFCWTQKSKPNHLIRLLNAACCCCYTGVQTKPSDKAAECCLLLLLLLQRSPNQTIWHGCFTVWYALYRFFKIVDFELHQLNSARILHFKT